MSESHFSNASREQLAACKTERGLTKAGADSRHENIHLAGRDCASGVAEPRRVKRVDQNVSTQTIRPSDVGCRPSLDHRSKCWVHPVGNHCLWCMSERRSFDLAGFGDMYSLSSPEDKRLCSRYSLCKASVRLHLLSTASTPARLYVLHASQRVPVRVWPNEAPWVRSGRMLCMAK